MIVYVLVDPRDRQVRYVGETGRSARSRLSQHIRTARERTTPRVNAWIRGLLNDGVEPEIIEVESASSKESRYAAEIYWIEQFSAMGASLLNLAKGGSSRVGFRHSEETKARWREQRRGENHPMFGKRRTPEQKAMFREIGKQLWVDKPHPNLGKKRSAETVERMRIGRTGVRMTDEQRARMSEAQKKRWAKAKSAHCE